MLIDGTERIDALTWDRADGLLPVVAQDARDGRVLMVAWTDREALAKTLLTGELHFHSRSRQELWHKGATSGNILQLISLHADCDADTLLALVIPAGPACHTGSPTCFGDAFPALPALDAVIATRQESPAEGSYTTRLLGDRNLRLKKITEEAGELVMALADGDAKATEAEAADLLYHLLVACRGAGLDSAAVLQEILRRRG